MHGSVGPRPARLWRAWQTPVAGLVTTRRGPMSRGSHTAVSHSRPCVEQTTPPRAQALSTASPRGRGVGGGGGSGTPRPHRCAVCAQLRLRGAHVPVAHAAPQVHGRPHVLPARQPARAQPPLQRPGQVLRARVGGPAVLRGCAPCGRAWEVNRGLGGGGGGRAVLPGLG